MKLCIFVYRCGGNVAPHKKGWFNMAKETVVICKNEKIHFHFSDLDLPGNMGTAFIFDRHNCKFLKSSLLKMMQFFGEKTCFSFNVYFDEKIDGGWFYAYRSEEFFNDEIIDFLINTDFKFSDDVAEVNEFGEVEIRKNLTKE